MKTLGRPRIGDNVLSPKERTKRRLQKLKHEGGISGAFLIRDKQLADAFRGYVEKNNTTTSGAARDLIALALESYEDVPGGAH